jgi:hypothetical protein
VIGLPGTPAITSKGLSPCHSLGNGLRVERSDGIIGLQTLAAELDAVNEASTKPSPFATSAFTLAYAAHSERDPLGMDVRLFVARDTTGMAVGWAVFAFRVDALFGVPNPACRLEKDPLAGLEAERRWGPSA